MVVETTTGGNDYTPEELAYLEQAEAGFEPEPEPAPAPEPQEDSRLASKPEPDDTDDDFEDDGAQDENGQPSGVVPKSAYLRVKGQSKELNDRLAQVAAELIRHREREAVLREMTERANPKPEAEPEREIDPNEDIFGAYAQMAKKLKELESKFGETDHSTRQRLEQMALQAQAQQDLTSFASKQPEFMDAYRHLVTARHRQLEALGVEDQAQRNQAIEAEARDLIASAIKSGQSAAERLWKLALASGYQVKPKDDADDPAAKINGKAKEEIDRINKGKKASVSLKGAGTAANSLENLTINRLAEMSQAEYNRTRKSYVEKYGAAAWDKLHGA